MSVTIWDQKSWGDAEVIREMMRQNSAEAQWWCYSDDSVLREPAVLQNLMTFWSADVLMTVTRSFVSPTWCHHDHCVTLTMSPMYPVLLLMIPVLLGDHDSPVSLDLYHHKAPMSLLRDLILGEVIPCCGPRYDQLREVNNRACVSRQVKEEKISVNLKTFHIYQARGYREAGNHRRRGYRCQLCSEKRDEGL